MKAVILYQSKTGTTKKYAEQTKSHLVEKGFEVVLSPIKAYNEDMLYGADYVFLGCWTNGLFLFLQHPDNEWIDFAKKLPENGKTKIAVFTTYKLLTGSMFRNMNRHLKVYSKVIGLKLKSKDGKLSESDKMAIDNFLS
jgi:flavodoxin